jgi:hypothetical protein
MGLENHPRRAEIDKILKIDAISIPQKNALIASKLGVSVSLPTLRKYAKTLLPAADTDSESESDGDGGALPFVVCEDDISEIENDLYSPLSTIRTAIAPILARIVVLTKTALENHTNGGGAYPAHYIRDLKTLTDLYKSATV